MVGGGARREREKERGERGGERRERERATAKRATAKQCSLSLFLSRFCLSFVPGSALPFTEAKKRFCRGGRGRNRELKKERRTRSCADIFFRKRERRERASRTARYDRRRRQQTSPPPSLTCNIKKNSSSPLSPRPTSRSGAARPRPASSASSASATAPAPGSPTPKEGRLTSAPPLASFPISAAQSRRRWSAWPSGRRR